MSTIIDPRKYAINAKAPVKTPNLKQAMEDVRVWVVGKFPFYGTLLAHLPFVIDTRCDTFYTNGHCIGYNPKFAETLTPAEIRFVVLHECLHVALLHIWRYGARDRKRANIAMDVVINNILNELMDNNRRLREKNVLAMPPVGINEPELAKLGPWEKVYEAIKVLDVPPNFQYGFDSHPAGEGANADGSLNESANSEAERWKVITTQAAQVSKAVGRGDMAGSLETLIDSLLRPKIRWSKFLASVAAEVLMDDYDWMEPDEDFLHQGIIIPDLYGEGCRVAFCVDTSGSVSDEMLHAAASEAMGLLKSRGVIDVLVLAADTEITYDKIHKPHDALPMNWKGRGGTSFVPFFDRLKDEPQIKLTVIFTDLDGNMPDYVPKSRVVWVTWNSQTDPPFGEKVVYEMPGEGGM